MSLSSAGLDSREGATPSRPPGATSSSPAGRARFPRGSRTLGRLPRRAKVTPAVSVSPEPKAEGHENKGHGDPCSDPDRMSKEHTSELQSQSNLVCRLLL